MFYNKNTHKNKYINNIIQKMMTSNNEEIENKIIELLSNILNHLDFLHQEILDIMNVYIHFNNDNNNDNDNS